MVRCAAVTWRGAHVAPARLPASGPPSARRSRHAFVAAHVPGQQFRAHRGSRRVVERVVVREHPHLRPPHVAPPTARCIPGPGSATGRCLRQRCRASARACADAGPGRLSCRALVKSGVDGRPDRGQDGRRRHGRDQARAAVAGLRPAGVLVHRHRAAHAQEQAPAAAVVASAPSRNHTSTDARIVAKTAVDDAAVTGTRSSSSALTGRRPRPEASCGAHASAGAGADRFVVLCSREIRRRQTR